MSGCIGCLEDSFEIPLVFLGYTDQLKNPKCLATQGLGAITGLALLIIGCLAAAGVFPGASLPWVTVGLGGGGFLLTLAFGNFENRKFELISRALMASTFIILGSLGGTGFLTTAEVAYGIIGTTVALLPMAGLNKAYELIEERRTRGSYQT